jgi:hypothetical protein
MTELYSEACARNEAPIAAVLSGLLPAVGTVWELGSGTGQHAVAFAARFPALVWHPTEREPDYFASSTSRVATAALPNLRAPRAFDLFDAAGTGPVADLLLSINVLHIAPWEATARLFAHAQASLPGPDARVVIYGPFDDATRPLAPSNAAFDASLRARDPRMGLRRVQAVDAVARDAGWVLEGETDMPANNRMRWWRRAG